MAKDKIKKKMAEVEKRFDKLVKNRQGLIRKLNQTNTQIERLKGKFELLKELEDG